MPSYECPPPEGYGRFWIDPRWHVEGMPKLDCPIFIQAWAYNSFPKTNLNELGPKKEPNS